MKKLFLLAWPIALAAVSCSNEEVVSVNNDANEIKFAAVVNNATRANADEMFCNNNKPGSFDVWAMTHTTTKSYFEKVTYTKGESDTEWKAPAENLRFWPNKDAEALDFYAMRNYGEVKANYWTPAGETVKLKADFAVASDVDKQKDFIYAVLTNKFKDGNNGQVELNFRHALSQVVFKAQNTNANLAVEITKVEVINVASSGTCNLPIADTTPNKEDHTGTVNSYPEASSICTWTGLNAAKASFAVETESCKMVGATAVTNLTNGDEKWPIVDGSGKKPTDDGWTPTYKRYFEKAMLLIPQTITHAAIDESNTPTVIKGETGTGTMLAVTCKIWNLNKPGKLEGTDVLLWDSVAYIPLSDITWQAGKKYIYTIIFGKRNGGFDDGGKDILVPISFDVKVDDFTPVVEQNINMFQ